MPNRSWTDNDLRVAVAGNISVAGAIKALGLVPIGGNYKTIKHHITRLEIDTSHHLGQAWSRDKYAEPNAQRTREARKRSMVLKHGHRCWRCKLEEWQGEPIPLELEHTDGNNSNNDESNLELLCCNCHALTPTWRGRNRRTRTHVLD